MRSALQAEDRLVTAAQLVFGVLIDKTKSPAEALDCLIMVSRSSLVNSSPISGCWSETCASKIPATQ